uniref:Uncharacterized protein n=1 Tax=Amphimedon queenslandica TaxID=400682 RepID=A0A1X7TJ16_AMPQE
VDEQLIMKRTGHRSTDGVQIYKHISDQQNAGRRFLNNIIITNKNSSS